MNEAELELVHSALAGDREAFGRLVQRFRGSVYAMSLAVTGDAEEAQELTQETFVRAYQGLPGLEQAERFPGWLRGITNTLGKDLKRKAARERRHLAAAAQQPLRAPQEAPERPLVEGEARALELTQLRELVAALPEPCRVALDLRFREELSYAQIGQAMGVPESTVRGLLYRGTRTLRLKLRPKQERGGPA